MEAVTGLKLISGDLVPIVGLGTWKSNPGEVENAVRAAVENGYRHIDCAFVYGNEKEIGSALKQVLGPELKREQLFITTKLWNTFHDPQHVREACLKSLSNLGLTYIDLYLIHWPYSFEYSGWDTLFPKHEDGSIKYSNTDYLDTWKALETLVDEGLIRNIGLSNFNSEQIQRILDDSRIKPSVLQVESHPYLNQEKLFQFAHQHNIKCVAYSPLGSSDRPWKAAEDLVLLEDPVVHQIAKKHGKTAAQVLIRFHVERGVGVIPKTISTERIKQNLDVFGFKLGKEDMDALLALNKNYRFCHLRRDSVHKYFPFSIEF